MSKKNEVRIPIKVDGKEILLTKKQVEQLNKSLDKTGTSAHSADRRLKGAAQASSNSTKNFSKMAQGITGGLVPAYATLAANIFAISAAFRFLQSAGDLRILQQGQLEYSQRTGQSLSILTRQLQAATDGQLAFAEAAQAVAIGTAAGLSAKQINELGKVAKNASLMLGRDLTDSFNRLVRGAVKAEPELLDELGIILRLDTAAEKYALTIGKTKQQLNIFEKSQAVVNEVLDQGIEKFGGVETEANALTKLAKSFDDLVNSIKRALGPTAEFIALAMSQNTTALAGAGMLLGTQITSAIIPKVPDFDFSKAGDSAKDKFASIYSGKRDLQNLDKKGLDALVRDTKKAYKLKSSTVINFERMKRDEALKTLEHIRISMQQEEAIRAKGIAGMTARYKLMVLQFKAENNSLLAHIKAIGTLAGRALSTAVRFAGYAGIVITVVGVLGQYLDKSTKAEKAARAAQREFGQLFSRNAEDLEKMVDGLKTFDSLMTNALQSARALSNIDYGQALKGLEGGMGGRDYSGPYSPDSFLGKINTLILGSGIGDLLFGKQSFEKTMSPDQMKGLQGIVDIQRTLYPLLLSNSAAADQSIDIISKLNHAINLAKKSELTREDFQGIIDLIESLKEGTIASKAMEGLSNTTQILSSSAQDFNKALNSFKSPQTELTRLTTNIDSVGGALSGLGERFAKMQVRLKFKAGGTIFDKATTDMLKTFLSEDDLKELDRVNKRLNHLATTRDYYTEQGDTVTAEKYDTEITNFGSKAFTHFGLTTQKEAKRLHDIEMKMIGDKTKVQTNLSLLTLGATKNQAKQLKMQSAIVQNNLNISNQETLLTELKNKGLTMDDAQLVTEQGKLDLLKAQGMQLQANIDHQFQLAQAAKDSFESGLQGTFDDLITGKNSSLTEGLANIGKGVMESVSKQLSEQMATGVSNFLFGNKELEGYQKGAEILKQAHVDGIRQGMGKGTGDISTSTSTDGGFMSKVFGTIGSFFGFEKGGITPSYAKGGITPVYAASGGVFKGSKQGYPAIMHGSEAVVPLPDGKSIPVSGGMGGNVNVSVNMTTGATTTESSGSDMYMMGEAVATAVQNELERQQRPGGMLSPY